MVGIFVAFTNKKAHYNRKTIITFKSDNAFQL